MADAVFSLEKLKKQFKTSQKRSVNFGFNPGNKDGEQMLLLDHIKGPNTLGKIARFEGSSSKMACGTLDSTSGIAVFTCEKPLPGMAKRIKRLFKRAKIMRKVQIVGPDGELLEEEFDEADGTDLPEDEAAPPSETAPEKKPDDGSAARWQERYGRLEPLTDKVLNAGLGDIEKIQVARSFVEKKAAAGDYAAALNNLPTLEKLLRAAAQAAARSKTGIQEGTVEKRQFMLTRWKKIPTELRAELRTLLLAIKADFPDEDVAGLGKAIDEKLNQLIGQVQQELNDAMDEAINAGDARYASVAKKIDQLRKAVSGDELVAVLRENAFSRGQAFEAAFQTALNEIESALTR